MTAEHSSVARNLPSAWLPRLQGLGSTGISVWVKERVKESPKVPS